MISKVHENNLEGVKCGKGVRQGCPMSPILFAVVLGELEERLKEKCRARGFQLQDYGRGGVEWKIPGLFLADDIVLFEGDEVGLQHLVREVG